MENIFLDKVKNLVDERTTASDPVAYVAKWDSLTTYVVSVFQDLKDVSSESVTSSNKRQKLLEVKIAFVTSNQYSMAMKQT